MNNLKKFSTEADYSAATLNYPAVSWVTATDNVHFDKSAPAPTVNNKVMMAWHSPSNESSGKDIVLWNAAVSLPPQDLFISLTLNDVDVMSTIGADGTLESYSTPNTDYLAKYELIDDDTITNVFEGILGGGWEYEYNSSKVDFLVPAQVTEIVALPQNLGNLVIEAATPPTFSSSWSDWGGDINIYVPDNAVSIYQSAYYDMENKIYPISDYQGNLPV